MRKTGMPGRREVVICRVTRLNPNSAYAELVEYNKTGMIHVSEVASRWVKDIREFLKEGQFIVCVVMKIEGDYISLSLKRVRQEEAKRKLNEFKRERKAEKLLEIIAKAHGKTLDQAYREAGSIVIEELGSLNKGFELAARNPGLLKERGVPADWAKEIEEAANKAYQEKEFEFKARLKLLSYSTDGVEKLKSELGKAEADGIRVHYVSAPNYTLSISGKSPKELEAKLESTAQELVKKFSKDGEASYELVKS